MADGASVAADTSTEWAVEAAETALRVCGARRIDAEVLLAGPVAGPLAGRLSSEVGRCHALSPAPGANVGTLVIEAAAASLPFTEGELDAVVLDRPGDEDSLAEAARVLVDRGLLVLFERRPDGGSDELEERLMAAGPWTSIGPSTEEHDLVGVTLRRRPRRAPRPAWAGLGPPAERQTADDVLLALARFLPEPVVVVDAGCRGGFQSHWLGLGPHARFIGFEADPRECDRLRRDTAGLLDATIVPLALGSTAGQATFFVPGEPAGSSLMPPDLEETNHLPALDGAQPEEEFTVDIERLDAWAAAEGIERVDAMKLDIEGGELDALRGATGLLDGVRAIEAEVHFNRANVGAPLFGEVDAFLRGHGFGLWRIRDQAHHQLTETVEVVLPEVAEYSFYQRLEGDVTPRPHLAQVGQLTWANAFWVARSTFRGDAVSWDLHLRDAVIFHVLQFHDLSHVALRRTLQASPPAEVAPDVRAVLAATGIPRS